MTAAVSNPFTAAYQALISLAAASPLVAQYVRPGNREGYDSVTFRRDPVKDAVAAADLPELVLISTGTTKANLQSDSTSTMITRRYTFVVSTGDFRISEFLYQVEWGLFVALASWKQVLTALTWQNLTYVKNTRLVEVSEGISDEEKNRGIKGWSAAWSCEVDMYFKTADLISAYTGES